MDKKSGRSGRVDFLQNLVIAALSVSFVLLLVQTPLFGSAGSDTLSDTVRGWFSDPQSAVSAEENALTALSVPVRIVQTGDFIRSGIEAVTTSNDAFEAVGSLFGEAFSSARGISTVAESAFLKALDGVGIYIEFPCTLPLEVLSARLGVDAPTSRELDVRRCLLSADGADNVQLYFQNAARESFCFSTDMRASALYEYLETQSGSEVDFAFSLGEEYAAFSPYTLIFSTVAERSVLSAANALGDYDTEELLRRAEFNPHTQDWYTESSGTVVYIEGQRKLYLHTDGTLAYGGAAAEQGSLFEAAAAEDGQPARTELCAAARSLIGTLTQGRLGDGAIYLSGMTDDASGATVFFDYMVDGTPVRFADGSHAAEVRIEHGSITAFSLRLRRYTRTEQASLLLSPTLARAVAQRYQGCELSVAYIDSRIDTVSASWIAD